MGSVAYEEFKSIIASVKPSPRVRRAAKLYGSGIARTKKEAAELAGIHPAYLSQLTKGNEEVKRLVSDANTRADLSIGDIGIHLQRLGREALATIDQIRRSAASEAVQLKAAIDLADRSPETSKVQKHQVESFTLDGEDVERFTRAIVESARVRAEFVEVHSENYIKVTSDPTSSVNAPLPFIQKEHPDAEA